MRQLRHVDGSNHPYLEKSDLGCLFTSKTNLLQCWALFLFVSQLLEGNIINIQPYTTMQHIQDVARLLIIARYVKSAVWSFKQAVPF